MSLVFSLATRPSGYRKDFDRQLVFLNESLASVGLPTYEYRPKLLSKDTELPRLRCSYSKFGEFQILMEDFLNPQLIREKRSHLMCSDGCSGVFLPISFGDVELPEGFLSHTGSSLSLRDELGEIAQNLQLDLGEYTPNSEVLFEQREADVFEDDVLGGEKMFLLMLYNVALGSIRHNLPIQLH